MTRARVRVVLAAVVACSPALVGASIASAHSHPHHRTDSPPAAVSQADTRAVADVPAHDTVRADSSKRTTITHSDQDHHSAIAKERKAARREYERRQQAAEKRKEQARRRKAAAARRKRAEAASRSEHRCTPPHHVAGLSRAQTYNARMIVKAGDRLHIGRKGKVIALSTALQESGLRNYANVNVPASMSIPHQAVGYDHDSVGLFQQRPLPPWGAGGWGTPHELMTPEISATKFYLALKRIPGWTSLPVTVAAQRVQVSAFPAAYADDEPQASRIVGAIHC